MSDETEKKTEQTQEPKPKKFGVPTQKTFIFNGRKTEKEIDSVINPWLKQQTLSGQMPMLVKLEFSRSIFSNRVIYVYMYNVPVEIKKSSV